MKRIATLELETLRKELSRRNHDDDEEDPEIPNF
jgi:hypothetical protein